jgi:uncharacterized glyoxalase superfamily protein PhnB
MTGVPKGFATLTPTLMVNGAAQAIDLYKKAFGATEIYRMESPNKDKIMHACILIGNSHLFLSDTDPLMCPQASVSTFYVYLDDVDAAFTQATETGLEGLFTPQDMFWGDRMGSVRDSFGITWTLATHVRDVSPEEMEEGRKSWGKAA